MPIPTSSHSSAAAADFSRYQIVRRNGHVVPFAPAKIAVAVTKAFLTVAGSQGQASASLRELVASLTEKVVHALLRSRPEGGTFHIDDVRDQVELQLLRSQHEAVAQAYALYRERRAQEQAAAAAQAQAEATPAPLQVLDGGVLLALDMPRLHGLMADACAGLGAEVRAEPIVQETLRNLYDGMPLEEVYKAGILAARTLIEQNPDYSYATARLLLHTIAREVLGREVALAGMADAYVAYFPGFIQQGVDNQLLNPELLTFDLPRLAAALQPERDLQFDYLGLQTLYDRYFLHVRKQRIELPQAFFMRVAMGLALQESDREARAIEFYEVLSRFDFMSSTPTLFNSGTLRSQLSSCYLTTVPDDLGGIYESIKENALLSKFAGGLGNDWTRVRALGSHIQGTNGESQGVVPFLKVVNDTAVAVNQCFAPDTLVYTATGPRPIRDVHPGDLVLGHSGQYREVTQRMVYNQHEAMVAIDVKHAIEPLEVTDAHPFWAIQGVPLGQANARTEAWLDKGKVTARWIDSGQLQTGDYIGFAIPTEVVPVQGLNEDDARLYGILLGDGHLSKDGRQWGVSGNPQRDAHLAFVRSYLEACGFHYWETARGSTYVQIHWAAGQGALRDGTTGRIVGAGAPTLPFAYDDLYDANHHKRIAPRLSHLPTTQTLALLQGLLETDGCVSRGKELTFTSASEPLAHGVRYQLLRLGVPVSGQKRTRQHNHVGQRSDGSQAVFAGSSTSIDLRIPAIPALAQRLGCAAVSKRNWLVRDGVLFSRVRAVRPITPKPLVVDLKVEVDASYQTVAGLAHNGGKRKGAVCTYLETWHLDIEEFLELRKNTGDDRRRTHDMNTANWIPDLFMKRVMEKGRWTLFSPSDVPDLHELFGADFERAYVAYEAKADRGDIPHHRVLPATDLWRKMLTMLFETGHPWITFKDACNVRSPQQHAGVVHSSNLCTEITLNTSDTETAVCNLGSVNLAQHLKDGPHGKELDHDKLQRTIRTAMRMLDNVIDINYYAVPKARESNLRHRPVGLGLMGFQDALYALRLPYASMPAVEFADRSMEAICYYAYWASTELAAERGRYSSYDGSLWSQGILPKDSIDLLAQARGGYVEVDRSQTLDWDALRAKIARDGMRNSNCVAIAPTATISNIVGVDASIEPSFGNLSVKSNLSGEFTVINHALVRDLQRLGLWDEAMVIDLKYFKGSLHALERVPTNIKALYATAFEIDPGWLVEAASRRQKWIDQAQSLNIYMAGASGKKLDETYKLAWLRGLKTTYYLRTQSATHAEMSTVQRQHLNAVSSGQAAGVAAPVQAASVELEAPATDIRFCAIDDPGCEACQ
ncbi:ribonucleoside-diphosphate reductase subunit alpha [Giesbergeria anulus]|uniref:Ribonucleoside-diphosphate reductase n=1 Tax=Giesbergeria anulus TaxID=180197 RepID=A0A1H9L6M1_9BURK|nr:ribonucleoside-diphosphate reductase subunit alpha [Giesbergeria anulus]SER06879.1 ribonucleoside-diphosphate reductase alpha chain [Giesbergeria anulus]